MRRIRIIKTSTTHRERKREKEEPRTIWKEKDTIRKILLLLSLWILTHTLAVSVANCASTIHRHSPGMCSTHEKYLICKIEKSESRMCTLLCYRVRIILRCNAIDHRASLQHIASLLHLHTNYKWNDMRYI